MKKMAAGGLDANIAKASAEKAAKIAEAKAKKAEKALAEIA
jgi:hypothetical protein